MVEELKMEKEAAPKDPFRINYVIFYWLGIGTLLPWNMFITVSRKNMFKLCDRQRNHMSCEGDPRSKKFFDLKTFPINCFCFFYLTFSMLGVLGRKLSQSFVR